MIAHRAEGRVDQLVQDVLAPPTPRVPRTYIATNTVMSNATGVERMARATVNQPASPSTQPAARAASRPVFVKIISSGSSSRAVTVPALGGFDESDVGAEELGGGDRTGVRRHEDVHDRERARGGQAVAELAAAHAPRDGEHDREHHHETRVEEDRKAEQQRGDAECHRRPALTELRDQRVDEGLRVRGSMRFRD